MLYRPVFRHSPRVGRHLQSLDGGQRQFSQLFAPSARPSPKRPQLSSSRPRAAESPLGGRQRLYHGRPWRFASPLTQGIITWGFIGANVLVWWKWQSSDQVSRGRGGGNGLWDMPRNFVLSYRNLSEGRWWTLLTHAISHRDGAHLAGNMVSYHAFVSAAFMLGISPLTIVTVGAGSALVGAVAGLADMRRKQEGDRGALGASALVLGLAAFVTCNAPSLRFFIFPIPVPIPLWLLTSGYVAWDVHRSNERNARVGHAAHVGGTLFGVLAFAARRLLRI